MTTHGSPIEKSRGARVAKALLLAVAAVGLAWGQTVDDAMAQRVSDALNRLEAAPKAQLAGMAASLGAGLGGADSPAGRLLAARAIEKSGDVNAAATAYRDVGSRSHGTPYAISAVYRLRLIELPNSASKTLDHFYQTIAKEPAAQGWFLAAGKWGWTTTRRAAWQALVDLRDDRLSFRLFSVLRSYSTFPVQYSYLFTLLVLAVGAKVLELPLMIKAAGLAIQIEGVKSEVEYIQRVHAGDLAGMNKSLTELYQRHGINPMRGCAVAVIDIIFVIWASVALWRFSPQIALDGGAFGWLNDVLRPDVGVLALWVACNVWVFATSPVKQPGQGWQMLFGQVAFGAVVAAIAWHWSWPAYAFILWSVVALAGWLFQWALIPIVRRFQ